MKVNRWQSSAVKVLKQAGISSADLDVLILMEDELGKDRTWILAHPETPLQSFSVQKLDRQIKRRREHEPLSYIRCKTEFYGRDFYINKHVLEPRPESETMITLLKSLLHHFSSTTKTKHLSLVDVGTGSGALAVTARIEIPELEVSATDIDRQCLKVARRNAKKYGVKIDFLSGDLLGPLFPLNFSFQNSIILANLPYIPDNFVINQAAAMEPKIAIFGGPDGLDIYRRLFAQLSGQIRPKYVFTESLPPQHIKLSKIASKNGYELTNTEDFIQIFKSKA